MTARNQSVADQLPGVSFAGQLHAALDRISDKQNAARTRLRDLPLANPAWRSTM